MSNEACSRFLTTTTAPSTYYTMCDIFSGLSMAMFRVSYDGKQQAQYEEFTAETRFSHRRCCAGYSHRLLARLERHSAGFEQQQCIRCPSKSRKDPCGHWEVKELLYYYRVELEYNVENNITRESSLQSFQEKLTITWYS